MELSTLQELANTPERLIEAVKAERCVEYVVDGKKYSRTEVGMKQYDPKQHSIKDRSKRPDRRENLPNGEIGPDGKAVLIPTVIPVARMSIPIQRYIIKQRASFAVGSKIELKPSVHDSPVYDAVVKQWKKNKIHYQLKDVARRLMAETEVAVIFYSDPG